jgi:prepilin peptidase CpaA
MRYFPDPLSGWLFLAALAAVLAVAVYTDERYTKLPKWLTLPALGLGLFASALRGGWLAANGHAVWALGAGGPALGAFDGLLFGLAGFAVGFTLFFPLWMLGTCGGGDVKFFAALGAWLGPYLTFLVLLVTLAILTVCLVVVLTLRLRRGLSAALPVRMGGAAARKTRVAVRFGLVAKLATLLVVLWSFRGDLRLSQPPARAAGHVAEGRGHGS